VRRALAIIVHNWPLKLAAVGLASLLYVGLVLAQNSKEWRGQVPIEVRNQPAGAVLTGGVQYVTSIRYFAPFDAAGRVTSDSFTAWIDLSTIAPDAENAVVVRVNVSTPDPEIQAFDWAPRQITVHLDPLRTKIVPVSVDKGDVPPDLDLRDPIVDPAQVSVSGTQSSVSQVLGAVARVRIDKAGLSIDQQVDLVAIDGQGEEVRQVLLEPASVHVFILIGRQLQSRSLPIHPVIVGTPAAGFELASVTVDPLAVSLEGDGATLSALSLIDTLPVSLTGATGDVTASVGLVLPPSTALLGVDKVTVTARLNATSGTRTFSAGPVLSGARDDRTYSLSTDQVLVTVGGTSIALAGLRGDMLAVTADVDGLAPGVHPVKLRATLPAGLTLIAISPPTLTVTVGAATSPPPQPSP
jgi:YbbR domain-containing protein